MKETKAALAALEAAANALHAMAVEQARTVPENPFEVWRTMQRVMTLERMARDIERRH